MLFFMFLCKGNTLPETNIAPENGWLEDEVSSWDGFLAGCSWQVSADDYLSTRRPT